MKISIVFLLLALMISCSGETVRHELKNHLQLPEEGFTFKLMQRSRLEIPSDSNSVFCRIDDITKGQCMLQLEDQNGIFLLKSVREKVSTDFDYNGEFYKLRCDKLVNRGLGKDYGFFSIHRDSENYREVKDESDAIEQLIRKVEEADIVFMRNGDDHTGKEAADHLRKKWDYADGQVKTVDGFIINLASKSSMSGKPYTVKLKNGKVMDAEDWFRTLLE